MRWIFYYSVVTGSNKVSCKTSTMNKKAFWEKKQKHVRKTICPLPGLKKLKITNRSSHFWLHLRNLPSNFRPYTEFAQPRFLYFL